jgi:hypothetical protein
MSVLFLRPRVADLVFRLFDRTVHPELYDRVATRSVERGGFRITAHITPTGHVLEWSHGAERITEALAATDQPLPRRGQRLGHKFGGSRGGRCELASGLRYQISTNVEILNEEQFEEVHADLKREGEAKGLVFHSHADSRLWLSPLGVVIVEALPRCLSISAFHTFPDELAVVRTQSLLERI